MSDLQNPSLMLFSLVALLLPTGLALVAIGGSDEESAVRVAVSTLVAFASAAIGYYICGFAFQFGGAGLVSGLPGLSWLTAEWSPMDVAWGAGWGAIGLRGFLLGGSAYTADAYALFVRSLPAVVTAVVVALLPLSGHVRNIGLFAVGLLISGFVYPLFANWVWGGGWLANLGQNLGQGHGYVDVGGSGTVFVLGALVALGGLLLLRPAKEGENGPARLPPVHFPLLAVLGTLLTPVGWAGLILGNPPLQRQLAVPVALGNLVLAAAASASVVLCYSWFVTGQPDALASCRGLVSGLVAAGAACGFVPPWAALVIGVVGGLLFLVGTYLWEQVLGWDDPTATIASFGLPGICGVLAVGVFADGRWGAGWNGVGGQEYLGTIGQGVTGLLVDERLQPAGMVQLQSQLVGLVALLVVALLVPLVVFRTVRWLRVVVGAAPTEEKVDSAVGVSDQPANEGEEGQTRAEPGSDPG